MRVEDAEGGTTPTPEERSDVGPTHEPEATTSGQRTPDEARCVAQRSTGP